MSLGLLGKFESVIGWVIHTLVADIESTFQTRVSLGAHFLTGVTVDLVLDSVSVF